MGYHSQLAWYLEGLLGPVNDGDAKIVVVETAAPFAVSVFDVTPRALEEGRKLIRIWWEQMRGCEDSDDWPSYAQSPVPFDIPEYDEPLLIDGEEVQT
jgi:hypothetical protein